MTKEIKHDLLRLRRYEINRKIILDYDEKLYFIDAIFRNTVHTEVYSKGYDGFYYRNMSYNYKKIDRTLDYKYMNWKNLSCCGGFIEDVKYLETAVQNGTKLLAGLVYIEENVANSENVIDLLKRNVSDTYSLIIGDVSKWSNYDRELERLQIDIVRNGALSDYYNFQEVRCMYKELLPKCSEYIDYLFEKDNKLSAMFHGNMKELIKGDTYNYANSKDEFEMIYTGLILGYPIESTAYLLARHYL